MKSALAFLIAARRCEVDELERLAATSALVEAIGRLVHALQRERGLSNVYLASGGARFGAQREAQVAECLRLEQAVRLGFDRLEDEAPARAGQDGTRLFSRVAWVLPGLLALPALRRRIGERELGAEAATAAFAKLIGGLLAVVFEAADGAADPPISRLLGALFQLMQGKEFAGQERACGAAAFAAGAAEPARQQRWLALIAAQERCFQSFVGFAATAQAEDWRSAQPLAALAEVERLRRIACASPAGTPLDPELSAPWFDACSQRLDAMKALEDRLAADLRRLCARRIADARAEAEAHAALLARIDAGGGPAPEAFFDGAPADAPALGRHMERAVLDMLQAQSQRLQTVSDELDALRAALNERKLVERAKGLLMAHRRLTEQEAHQLLRQTAMNQNRRLVDVAESVLSMADWLPAGA